jgi:membrane dipeptidase
MRLIDLHVDWLLQYAQETTVFDSALYPGVPDRVGQLDGYLQSSRAAILACYRRGDDWASQTDPWAALGPLITRIEAEFPGRLLIGPDDFDRWRDDRDGLTWGMIGVEGFDALIRSPEDLDQLPRLFERGVRLFQPIHGVENRLGGSAVRTSAADRPGAPEPADDGRRPGLVRDSSREGSAVPAGLFARRAGPSGV